MVFISLTSRFTHAYGLTRSVSIVYTPHEAITGALIRNDVATKREDMRFPSTARDVCISGAIASFLPYNVSECLLPQLQEASSNDRSVDAGAAKLSYQDWTMILDRWPIRFTATPSKTY